MARRAQGLASAWERGAACGVRPVHRIAARAGTRARARAGPGQAGLRLRAESEAPAHLGGEKAVLFIFQFFFFSNFSKCSCSKSIFEQQNGIFWKWPKNKSCLEFNPLQLCLKDQLKIPNRF
jgi:hypothetical protein